MKQDGYGHIPVHEDRARKHAHVHNSTKVGHNQRPTENPAEATGHIRIRPQLPRPAHLILETLFWLSCYRVDVLSCSYRVIAFCIFSAQTSSQSHQSYSERGHLGSNGGPDWPPLAKSIRFPSTHRELLAKANSLATRPLTSTWPGGMHAAALIKRSDLTDSRPNLSAQERPHS